MTETDPWKEFMKMDSFLFSGTWNPKRKETDMSFYGGTSLDQIIGSLRDKQSAAETAKSEREEIKYDLDNQIDDLDNFIEEIGNLIDSLDNLPEVSIDSIDLDGFDSSDV